MIRTIPKLATFATVAVLASGGSIAIAAAAPDPGAGSRGGFGGVGGPGGPRNGGPPGIVPSGTLPGNGAVPSTARSTGAGVAPSNGSGTTP